MKTPTAPPPLTKMIAHQAALEAERKKAFETWRAALIAACGNVARAAASLGWSRDKGHSMTRRFKLVDWAKELRVAAGALPGQGRPRKE